MRLPSRLISTICGPPLSALRFGFFRVSRAMDDAAEADRSCLLGLHGIRDVILNELPRTPARYIKEAVVEREIDVRNERRRLP